MGYSVRLGKVMKCQRELIKGKTADEVEALISEQEQPYRPGFHTELYAIGKTSAYEPDSLTPFYDFDIQATYGGADFRILSKEGLIQIIKTYEKEVADYYSSLWEALKTDVDSDKPHRIYDKVQLSEDVAGRLFAMLMSKRNDWNGYGSTLQLDEGCDGEINKSHSMDYAIFNLVFILKTFDFDNDYLIYSGW